tara:strand:- start:19 stop:597 length:579 start_codon:yes stop_codon:yes gene_type:complete
MDNFGVLLPVKSFNNAKARLSSVLNPIERAALSRSLAEGVISACTGVPVWVICEDEEVEQWALSLGTQVIRNTRTGLNQAAQTGLAALANEGIEKVLITHADLIFPDGLLSLFQYDGIALVPDRHNDGTNIIGLPPRIDFSFKYGPNSFEKHSHEAKRFDLPLSIIRDTNLGFDMDNPDDLKESELHKEDLI